MQDDTKQIEEVNVTRPNAARYMVKLTAKNSVFLDLFQNKSYLLKLYKTLHPEDTTATEDSLTDMSLEEIVDYVPSLSLEELKELEAEVMQLA